MKTEDAERALQTLCQIATRGSEAPPLTKEEAQHLVDRLHAFEDALREEKERSDRAEARADGFREVADMKHEPCPCLHTTPCNPSCTCLHPVSSRGCRRCCTYGSKEQQGAMARHLAACIDAGPPSDAYAMPAPQGYGVWRVGEGFVTMRSKADGMGMTLEKAREVAGKLIGKPAFEIRPIPASCPERHAWTDVVCRSCGLGVPHEPKG